LTWQKQGVRESLGRLAATDTTLMRTQSRTQSAATKLLDHIDGWQKAYADDIATIHVRKAGAMHTAEPVIDPVAH
jgi:hypothetical protein